MTKKQRPLFFLGLLVACCSMLQASFSIRQINQQIDEDSLLKTGLYKLTEEEKNNLDLWIEFDCEDYYIKHPKISNWYEVDYLFKSVKFQRWANTPHEVMNCVESEVDWKWDLALTAVFQHEAPFLKEFIEFHKLMGVQHFYLYNNLSNDHYFDVLQEFIDNEEVELIEWPVRNFVYGQCSCYTDTVERSRGKARWLILADSDLFFFPLQHPDLISFLREYEHQHIGGVVTNMYYYGTSNVWDLKDEELLIEKLVYRDPQVNKLVRSIIKPHKVWKVDNPHYAIYLPGYYAVDEKYNPRTGALNDNFTPEKFRINHYKFRTKRFLYGIYGLRHLRFAAEHNGTPFPTEIPPEMKDQLDRADEQYNRFNDNCITIFAPLLREQMSKTYPKHTTETPNISYQNN